MLFSGKENVFRCLAAHGIRFTEMRFWCLFPEFVLRNEIYGKSFPAFVSGKYFPKNEIHFFTEHHFSIFLSLCSIT